MLNRALTVNPLLSISVKLAPVESTMRSLATIGYERATLPDVINALTVAGVRQLIDVRAVPISRKRGFSKHALSAALNVAGIGYTHCKALGNPKAGREAARRGDRHGFLSIYGEHLATAEARAALDEAVTLASNIVSCLMCFEREYVDCHRSLIAAALAEREGFQIQHLAVTTAS